MNEIGEQTKDLGANSNENNADEVFVIDSVIESGEEISIIEDENIETLNNVESLQLYKSLNTKIENTNSEIIVTLPRERKTINNIKVIKIEIVRSADQTVLNSTDHKSTSTITKNISDITNTIRCHVCDLILDNTEEFNNHITIHILPNAESEHQCGKCQKIFGNPVLLLNHITDFVKDPYKCCKCDKLYQFRLQYIEHMKIHDPNQICDKCGLSFPTVELLKKHEATHSVDKPYKCQICFQEMKHKGTYVTHMKRHQMTPEERNVRKFACEVCGKMYRTLDALNIHKISHTTEKKHECALCGKKFKYTRCLRYHVEIKHFNKRSICHVCGKKFVTDTVLKKHLRLHTGKQPYKCHLCPKAFCDPSIHYKEMLTHSNMRTQVCQYCGIQFKQRNSLYMHIKKNHSDVSEVNAKDDIIDCEIFKI